MLSCSVLPDLSQTGSLRNKHFTSTARKKKSPMSHHPEKLRRSTKAAVCRCPVSCYFILFGRGQNLNVEGKLRRCGSAAHLIVLS